MFNKPYNKIPVDIKPSQAVANATYVFFHDVEREISNPLNNAR
jgi:hypothetical protein